LEFNNSVVDNGLSIIEGFALRVSKTKDSRRESAVDKEVQSGFINSRGTDSNISELVSQVVPVNGSVDSIISERRSTARVTSAKRSKSSTGQSVINGENNSGSTNVESVDGRTSKVVVGVEELNKRVDSSKRRDILNIEGNISVTVGNSTVRLDPVDSVVYIKL
jgi:hypothetical protein